MELYSTKDLELAKVKLPELINKIDDIKDKIFEPTKKEKLEVNSIVLNFIKENKRKIYGGYALNKLISKKDPNDAFYKNDVVADIDIYSPDPIIDLQNLANILFEKKFKQVESKSAMHRETYTTFVNGFNACDITYVPASIYHRIPFEEIDGINYISPSFAMIDMYRILNDPYFSSSQRWEKVFPRLYLTQKHYKFNKATSRLVDPDTYKENIYIKLLNKTKEFITRDSIIVYSRYCYNFFLEKSKVVNKIFNILEDSYYECISTNYVQDVKDLLEVLKLVDSKITLTEHYPFWQLLGYSSYIKYNDKIIIKLVHYQKKCTPFIRDKNINYASFDMCLLMSMINSFYMRVNKDNTRYQFYNIMTSHLVEMRNYYLRQHKKTMFDDTPFQEFLITCLGDAIDPQREEALLRKQRFLQHKNVIFKYVPDQQYIKEPVTNYRFPNSSGNVIYSSKNYRIEDSSITRGNDSRETQEATDSRNKKEALKEVEPVEDNQDEILEVKDLLKIEGMKTPKKGKKK